MYFYDTIAIYNLLKQGVFMTKDEAMLKLRDELLAVEQDRANGIEGYTIDEVEEYLDKIIENSCNEKSSTK